MKMKIFYLCDFEQWYTREVTVVAFICIESIVPSLSLIEVEGETSVT
jgi:hypothetical protein